MVMGVDVMRIGLLVGVQALTMELGFRVQEKKVGNELLISLNPEP
jgi:hypothetical protein